MQPTLSRIPMWREVLIPVAGPSASPAIACNRGYVMLSRRSKRAAEASEPGPPGPDGQQARKRVGLRDYMRYFLGLGIWGFGGPIATVGYMQRDLVEKRGWLDRGEFLNGVALGQTMPGPLAAQVCMWIGYLQAGALGALATALPFILPSFAIVLSMAAWKLAKLTDDKDPRLWIISAITLAVTAVTGAEIALLFVGAGVVMMLWEAPPRFLKRMTGSLLILPKASPGLWLGAATGGTLVTLGLFFLKAGAFIFGS